MNKHLFNLAFFIGAAAVIWVGIGFLDSSTLAMTMTALIFLVYLGGAVELHRFRKASGGLTAALVAVPDDMTDLNTFLAGVDNSLQHPVRLRIEGERAALPGPALTPYLVGLLVMLGMLGTFLGMVVTLKGAVFTLEKTADLEAMRSALAVPVQGLGLAFGTSVAGVAASAMLGLMSALCRRERMQAGQLLDARTATVLNRFSHTRQRDETFRALQTQSAALPQVVDKLQAMMQQMEAMSGQLNQRLLDNQDQFHRSASETYTELARSFDSSVRETLAMSAQLNQRLLENQDQFHSGASETYATLARSVDSSLRETLAQSAHAVGDSVRPVLETAMQAMAQEARAMHERTASSVQQQLDGLAERFSDATGRVAATWETALDKQEQANRGLTAEVAHALEAFGASFEQRASTLVANVGDAYVHMQAEQAERDQQRQQAWTGSLESMAAALTRSWQDSGAQVMEQQRDICAAVTHAVGELAAQVRADADASLGDTARLLATAEDLMRSRIAAEAQWLDQHRERMDQLTALLQSELGALRDQEAARGDAAVARMGELQCAVTTHLSTLGTALEAPITRLIDTAAEAPRAAAEVIAQLRQEMSHSVARDNALLEERSRILETLNTLLDDIQHASHEQRAVIDALVASSSAKLDAASETFSANVAGEAGKLSDIAAHVTSSAVDVASLADAFGVAVQSFNDANEKLASNLERIEIALDKSMTRSDGQLAYYVAQAREIIDLSMSSQKQIVDQLRHLPALQAEESN
ncbi:DUF802 domain-containing protein [Massilia sp. PAMC28688]|uniref:DUF802 domain-containing protein n=1 Tax=Massilia sp. PAMC28688 TaxID=2861283 RepID=UPI001C6312CA|nr:DUF802 domain-containing protein [Massilia sp. PAMC28688]QYF93339.1 DUF802 domain-containing protein [Massilia sp. PAMC28688]